MTKFWKVQPADRPVLSINGVREGDRLRLELEAGAGSGHDHAVAAPGNWEDILEAVLALRGAIGRAATYSPNNFAVLEDGERRAAIADIAALGHALFLALVPEGTPLRSFFESIGRSPATRQVIVRGAATFVPWEFLYAHPVLPGEEVRPELFAAHNVVF